MYGADTARTDGAPRNDRATSLMEACGHRLPPGDDGLQGGVYGDVFVGRCRDDEPGDVWERVDMGAGEVDPGSGWCVSARKEGGGGGEG